MTVLGLDPSAQLYKIPYLSEFFQSHNFLLKVNVTSLMFQHSKNLSRFNYFIVFGFFLTDEMLYGKGDRIEELNTEEGREGRKEEGKEGRREGKKEERKEGKGKK